jgi:hypothetical protein
MYGTLISNLRNAFYKIFVNQDLAFAIPAGQQSWLWPKKRVMESKILDSFCYFFANQN